MLSSREVKELLRSPKKIVIVTHHKPDGDAMGSALGMYAYLIQLGHSVQVITPTDYPAFLHWMPGHNNVLIFTEAEHDAAAYVAEAEVIVATDFNSLARINELGTLVAASTAVKIMIDHHLEPEGFEDYSYSDIMASSASELVYGFITEVMEQPQYINADVATCLYTGIMTDSGSFKYERAGSKVYRIAANLIDAGAPHSYIQDKVYNNASEDRLRLLGYCLANKMEVWHNYNTAVITISADELKRFNYQVGDTEGVVNFALSITGIRLAALIIERTDKVKLSIRSTGNIPANDIARRYFNGGGHLNAAGGSTELGLDAAKEKFKEVLEEYKTFLQV